MKKFSFVSLFLVLAIGKIAPGNAAIVTVGTPEVVVNYEQPIQAQETVYYDPAVSGVNLYYWNGGEPVYVGGHPHWGGVRVGYWHGHDHWHGGGREVSYHIHERVNIHEGHRHH